MKPDRKPSNEWQFTRTPPEFFNLVMRKMGWDAADLDAAADIDNTLAINYLSGPHRISLFTLKEPPCVCGLCAKWGAQRVWLNPPWEDIQKWMDKVHKECTENDITVVMLLPNSTSALWFHKLWEISDEIWLLTRRIPFLSETGVVGKSTNIGSVVAIARGNPITSRKINENKPTVEIWDWKHEITI